MTRCARLRALGERAEIPVATGACDPPSTGCVEAAGLGAGRLGAAGRGAVRTTHAGVSHVRLARRATGQPSSCERVDRAGCSRSGAGAVLRA